MPRANCISRPSSTKEGRIGSEPGRLRIRISEFPSHFKFHEKSWGFWRIMPSYLLRNWVAPGPSIIGASPWRFWLFIKFGHNPMTAPRALPKAWFSPAKTHHSKILTESLLPNNPAVFILGRLWPPSACGSADHHRRLELQVLPTGPRRGQIEF